LANSNDTAQLEPNPFSVEFELKNSFEDITFKLENYVANGPPWDEVPDMLEFTPLNARDTSNVIFDLPHQDRLHTILLCYRDVKNKNVGFDICTVVRLQGPRDENNGFKRANQTTTIRYINSQEDYNSIIETKIATIYSREKDNDNYIIEQDEELEYGLGHESLKYIVEVEHECISANLLDFRTTIYIEPRNTTSNHQHQAKSSSPTEKISGDVMELSVPIKVKPQITVAEDEATITKQNILPVIINVRPSVGRRRIRAGVKIRSRDGSGTSRKRV
jgi:hypothetical protein